MPAAVLVRRLAIVAVPLSVRLAEAHVYNPAHVLAELCAEVSGIEIDAIEKLRGNRARYPTEVVDERHTRAVDEHGRVCRRGPAYDEEPCKAGRASDARQGLNRTQCVAGRAWNPFHLSTPDGPARHFALRALALDGDFDDA